MPNDYELIFKVSDSSGNTAEYRSTVSVEALPMDEEPADQNQSALNIVNDPDSITVMINKQYALPDGWEPVSYTHLARGLSLSIMNVLFIFMRQKKHLH